MSIFDLFKQKKEKYTLLGLLYIYHTAKTYYLPTFICQDGFDISVQYFLGSMRDYGSLECAVSVRDSLLDAFEYEYDESLKKYIYGYVPIMVLVALVEKHGRIISSSTHSGRVEDIPSWKTLIPNQSMRDNQFLEWSDYIYRHYKEFKIC